METYQQQDDTSVAAYSRVHANGERTHVYILEVGTRYAAVATDVDPVAFDAVAGELIAYSPTVEAAREHSTRWMETHPKGVAGTGGGWLSKLTSLLGRVDDAAAPGADGDADGPQEGDG